MVLVGLPLGVLGPRFMLSVMALVESGFFQFWGPSALAFLALPAGFVVNLALERLWLIDRAFKLEVMRL